MKSSILIKRLLELDPEGNIEVFVGGSDIYFVDKLPYYYDGKPDILIKDESRQDYNVIGVKQMDKGEKIELKTFSLDDVVFDDDKDKNIYEGDESFQERLDKYRTSRNEILREVDFGSFWDFVVDKLNKSIFKSDLELFFNKYEKQLRRSGFSSIVSSVKDKQWRYWADCIKLEDGKLKYVEGFEDKNYNEISKNRT